MKLYTFSDKVKDILAVSFPDEPEQFYSLALLGYDFPDMNALIIADAMTVLSDLKPSSDALINTQTLRLRAPIPHPRQDLLCLGMNYSDHAVESLRFDSDAFGDLHAEAVYFGKRVFEASGDGDPIPSYPGLVHKLDYECELAVVIGRDAFHVSEDDAAQYVLGYTIVNDVSARNLQTIHKQWYWGKSLDGFAPMGPCILTADEVGFPPELEIKCYVNGELRQQSNTKNLIHTIAQIISEISTGTVLKAGSIIATGTPSGVGMGMQPPCFLKSGDIVMCEIEKIGTLTNTVK